MDPIYIEDTSIGRLLILRTDALRRNIYHCCRITCVLA